MTVTLLVSIVWHLEYDIKNNIKKLRAFTLAIFYFS